MSSTGPLDDHLDTVLVLSIAAILKALKYAAGGSTELLYGPEFPAEKIEWISAAFQAACIP